MIDHRKALQSYLDSLAAEHKPLPGIGERINRTAVARAAGLPAQVLSNSPELQAMLQSAAQRLGLEDLGRPTRLHPRAAALQPGDPTYREIKEHARTFFLDSGLSESSLPSYHSALNKWMEVFKVGDDDRASRQLGADLAHSMGVFSETQQPTACSRIRQWVNLYKKLSNLQANLPNSFSETLCSLIDNSGKSRNEISKLVGISHSNINNWINASSQPATKDVVARLEVALQVPPGTLMDRYAPTGSRRLESFRRVPHDWWPKEWQPTEQHKSVNTPFAHKRRATLVSIPERAFFEPEDVLRREFDRALKAVQASGMSNGRTQQHGMYSSEKYGLPLDQWNPILQEEWRDFYNYKTADDGFHNQERTGRWKDSSAAMKQQDLHYFFGYLVLKPNSKNPIMSGLGVKAEELTLALLSFEGYTAKFLEFKRERSGNFNSTTRNFIDFVASILRPRSGWLWMQESMLSRLDQSLQQQVHDRGGWHVHCEKTRTSLLKILASFTKKNKIIRTRDPFKPILPLLKMDQPLHAVIKGLKVHRRALEMEWGSKAEVNAMLAAEWRNHLLVSFLIRFPLRAKHWRTMTYRPHDDTGHLRRNDRGWEMVLPYTDFKNYANTSIFERRGDGLLTLDFSTPQYALLHQLSGLLDEYTQKYWPVLAGDTDLLFPTRASSAMTVTNLNTAIRQWTGEYVAATSPRGCGIPGVVAFGPHAFRDLVATSLVKNASVDDAAAALLDSRKMVEQHYARFVPADRLKNAFTALEPAFIGYGEHL